MPSAKDVVPRNKFCNEGVTSVSKNKKKLARFPKDFENEKFLENFLKSLEKFSKKFGKIF